VKGLSLFLTEKNALPNQKLYFEYLLLLPAMKKFLLYIFLVVVVFGVSRVKAQVAGKDSVVQLYGVVMTADSLQAVPSASVIVLGTGRGTITNDQGVFSIAVLKGDRIKFTSIGFKDHVITVPKNIPGDQYSVIQLLVNDTMYLPATIIKPRPSAAEFGREFVNTNVPADQYEIARENTSAAKRRLLLSILPADGQEAVSRVMAENAQKLYYQGQQPPINLLNPAAWADFIQSWKRGDFKSNSSQNSSSSSSDGSDQ
jgi:hypothetical protein